MFFIDSCPCYSNSGSNSNSNPQVASPTMTDPKIELHAFRAFIARQVSPSNVLGPEGIEQNTRLANAIFDVLKQKWDAILYRARDANLPVMYIYGSDGWGCNLTEGHAYKFGDYVMRRSGKVRAEFLLERALLKSIDYEHRVNMAIKFSAPRKMTKGKLGWNIWQAAVEYHPLLRREAGTSFAINWYLQDGLHHGGMQRRMLARHELYYDNHLDDDVEDGDPLQSEKDICITWKCTSHVISNGIKWGLDSVASDQIIDDLSIGILSLINSSEELLKQVDKFVFTRVTFDQPSESVARRSELWSWLGVPDDRLAIVLAVNPVWRPGAQTLSVSVELAHSNDRFEKVAAVIVFFLSWRRFSVTRWGGVTSACQRLIRSYLIGLDYLCMMVFNGGGSAYHLHGFKRIGPEVRTLAAVGSLGMWPLDRFALELLEDDRLLLRAKTLMPRLEQDATKTTLISSATWEAVAECIAQPCFGAHDLRDTTIHCMFTGLGYIHMHALRLLAEYPAKLTQGDVSEKIRELLRDEGVEEFNAKRLRTALLCGVPESEATRALLLLRDAPCTTGLHEKAHKPAALLHRQHKLYGSQLLGVRSAVIQAAPLFTKAKPTDPIEARLRMQLDQAKAEPVRLTAKMYYCSMLVKEMLSGGCSPLVAKGCSQEAIKRHHALFKALVPHEKDIMRRDAEQAKRRRVKDRDEKVAHLAEQLRRHIESKQHEEPDDHVVGVRNVVGEMRFNDDDVIDVQRIFDELGRNASCEANQFNLKAPGMPDPMIRGAVETKARQLMPGRSTSCVWWCQAMVVNRELFCACALAETWDKGHSKFPDKAFLIVYPCQQPAQATFLELCRRPCRWPAMFPTVPRDEWPIEAGE